MKRFKKLTIYILVGVLVSSTVMTNYKEGEVVKASATLTLGTGALLALAVLAAYGIVYTGAINSDTGLYDWQGDIELYGDNLARLEDYMQYKWNVLVNDYSSQNGYNPNDDWNGDDDKPSTWEKMKEFINKNPSTRLTFLMGSAFSLAFGKALYESASPYSLIPSGIILNNGDVYEYGYDSTLSDGKIQYMLCGIKSISDGLMVSHGIVGSKFCTLVVLNMPLSYKHGSVATTSNSVRPVNSWTEMKNAGYKVSYVTKNHDNWVTIDDTNYYYDLIEHCEMESFNATTREYNVAFASSDVRNAIADTLKSDFIWNDKQDDVWEGRQAVINGARLHSDFTVNGDEERIEPIFGGIYLPTSQTVGNLLNGLESNTQNSQGTQQVLDEFVNSLQQPQTNPNPNPNPNPDEGGDSGEGSGDEDNTNLLADLKGVFPFCIPFDLIDCFKLFNAEPVTPRVEIPLHFGIVEKDYTFVIDLEDFNGVAQVCRAMFLILFIVGLVLSTRSLIRG